MILLALWDQGDEVRLRLVTGFFSNLLPPADLILAHRERFQRPHRRL